MVVQVAQAAEQVVKCEVYICRGVLCIAHWLAKRYSGVLVFGVWYGDVALQ
jgi:hypothetical protein